MPNIQRCAVTQHLLLVDHRISKNLDAWVIALNSAQRHSGAQGRGESEMETSKTSIPDPNKGLSNKEPANFLHFCTHEDLECFSQESQGKQLHPAARVDVHELSIHITKTSDPQIKPSEPSHGTHHAPVVLNTPHNMIEHPPSNMSDVPDVIGPDNPPGLPFLKGLLRFGYLVPRIVLLVFWTWTIYRSMKYLVDQLQAPAVAYLHHWFRSFFIRPFARRHPQETVSAEIDHRNGKEWQKRMIEKFEDDVLRDRYEWSQGAAVRGWQTNFKHSLWGPESFGVDGKQTEKEPDFAAEVWWALKRRWKHVPQGDRYSYPEGDDTGGFGGAEGLAIWNQWIKDARPEVMGYTPPPKSDEDKEKPDLPAKKESSAPRPFELAYRALFPKKTAAPSQSKETSPEKPTSKPPSLSKIRLTPSPGPADEEQKEPTPPEKKKGTLEHEVAKTLHKVHVNALSVTKAEQILPAVRYIGEAIHRTTLFKSSSILKKWSTHRHRKRFQCTVGIKCETRRYAPDFELGRLEKLDPSIEWENDDWKAEEKNGKRKFVQEDRELVRVLTVAGMFMCPPSDLPSISDPTCEQLISGLFARSTSSTS